MSLILLNVPYSEKDEASALGAKWNPDYRKWTISSRNPNLNLFAKWLTSDIAVVDPVVPLESELELIKNMEIANILPSVTYLSYDIHTKREEEYAKLLGASIGADTADPTKMFARFSHKVNAQIYSLWNIICNQKYKEKTFDNLIGVSENSLFLDLETTGLGDDAEPIEIGIVDAYGSQLFHSYFKPDTLIESGAMKCNKITNKALLLEPRFTDCIKKIFEILCTADNLYIYNAKYDLKIIKQTLEYYKVDKSYMNLFDQISSKTIDAMEITTEFAKRNFNWDKDRISLQKITELLGIDYVEKHSASSDAYLIIRVLREIYSRKEETLGQTQKTQYFNSCVELQKEVVKLVSSGNRYVGHIHNPENNSYLLIYE